MNMLKRLILSATILFGTSHGMAQSSSDLDLSTRCMGAPPTHATVNSVAQWLQNPFELKLEIAVTNFFAGTNEYMEIIIGDQRRVFYGAGIDDLGKYIPTNYPPVEVDAIIRRDYQMSITCPNSGPDGSPLFKLNDISDPYDLGVTLSSSGAPELVSQFLWSNFSGDAQSAITNDDYDTDPNYLITQTNLVIQLNRIITSGSIYDSNRFFGVTLTSDTTNLLAQNPQGQDLVFLNRLLLHDAYGWSIPNGYDGSGTAQISFFVKPPTQYKISKNKPVDKYSVLVNGPNSQQFADGSAQINLQNPADGYLSTNSAVIRVLKDKFGHYGIGDGCDDPRPAPGVGTWLNMGPGCTQDTNRISLDWSVSLGRTFDGLAIGRLSLREIELSRNSYTPYPLYYNAASTNLFSEVELVTTNLIVSIIATTNQVVLTTNIWFGGSFHPLRMGITNIVVMETNADMVLRQVKAYQVFVDILTPDTNQTVLKFYFPGQVHTNKDEYGVYTNIEDPPFVVWTIKNPNPATVNNLLITENRPGGGSTNSLAKTTSAGDVTWTLTQGTGPETRIETRTVSFLGSPATDRVELNAISYANSGPPAYQCQETYHFYPWGSELKETKIPNSPDMITIYDYYDNQNNLETYSYYGNGQLKQIVYPDGYWEKRIYENVDNGDRSLMSINLRSVYANGLLRYVLHPNLDGQNGGTTDVSQASIYNTYYTEYGYETFGNYRVIEEYDGTSGVSSRFHLNVNGYEPVAYNPTPEGVCRESMSSGFYLNPAAPMGGSAIFDYNEQSPLGLAGHNYSQSYKDNPTVLSYYDHGTYNATTMAFALDAANHMYVSLSQTNYPDYRQTTIQNFDKGTQSVYDPAQFFDFAYDEEGHFLLPGSDFEDGTPFDGTRLVALKTPKTTRIFHNGNLIQTENWIYTGLANTYTIPIEGVTYGDPQWLLISKNVYQADIFGRVTNVVRIDPVSMQSNTIYTADYQGGSGVDGKLLLAETDQTGASTSYTYDSLQRVQTATAKGYNGQPKKVTTYTYDANGHVLNQVTVAGSLSQSQSQSYDLAGRVTNHVDVSGINIQTTYSSGGAIVTSVYPGGITIVHEQYLDRRAKDLQGSGVVAQYYNYSNCPVGPQSLANQNTSIGLGEPNSPRWKVTGTNTLDTIAYEWHPAGAATTYIISKNYMYVIPFNRLYASYGDGIPDTFYYYDVDSVQNCAESEGDDPNNGRVNCFYTYYTQIGNAWFQATTNYALLLDGSDSETMTSVHLEQLNGLAANVISCSKDYDADTNLTVTTTYVDRPNNKITTVTSQPNTSSLQATSVYQNGRPISSSTLSVASPTVYKYDNLGRTNQIISALGYSAYINYDPATGWVTSMTDFTGQTNSYQYYGVTEANAGKLKCQTSANGKKTYYAYTTRGELYHTWGDVPYPAEYRYSEYGDLTNLITFRGGSGWSGSSWPNPDYNTGDNTYWVYDAASGALLQKIDALGKAVTYSYSTVTGRLLTRSWARLNGTNTITVTNSYNGFGDLAEQDYNDGTPNVYFNSYNRAGQPREIIDGSGTTEMTYDFARRLVSSFVNGGLLNGITVSNHFNPYYGRDAVAVLGLSTSLEDDYVYDNYGRLSSVGSGTCLAVYGYVPNSDLLQTTTFKNSGNTVLTTTRTWDYGMRLHSIANVVDSTPVTSHSYQYDAVNRRTRATLEDGSYWNYGYDDRDELMSAKRNWSYFTTSTPVSGQQFGYAYDNIGNRQTASFGGDTNGLNLRTNTYTNNSLNQYIGITTPGYENILGAALATNSVTVNNGTADRKGEYFHREIAVANGSGPVWQNVTNIAGTFTNKGGSVFPANGQALAYDADGNLSADGIWTYQWDAENRLISMAMTGTVANLATTNRLRLDFAYDFMGRRVQKIVSVWNVTTNDFVPSTTNRFVYDGWNLLAILSPNSQLLSSYMWGKDLSGTMTRAGGVGGLLMANISGTNCFATYDGNGNITALINAADKSLAARYEYSPYGELLRETGLLAHQNPFRFSTKYWDDESGLVYYNYRFYSPVFGRWINRDPSGEKDNRNLHGFVRNNPLITIDINGNEGWVEGFEDWAQTFVFDFANQAEGIYKEHFFPDKIAGFSGFLKDMIRGIASDKLADLTINPSIILEDVGQSMMSMDIQSGIFMQNAQRIITGRLETKTQTDYGIGLGVGLMAAYVGATGGDADNFILDVSLSAAGTMGVDSAETIWGVATDVSD